jgi:hypothetical protein
MMLAVNAVVTLGYVFVAVGLVLILVSVPSILRKASARPAQTLGFWEAITKIVDIGGAGAIVALLSAPGSLSQDSS